MSFQLFFFPTLFCRSGVLLIFFVLGWISYGKFRYIKISGFAVYASNIYHFDTPKYYTRYWINFDTLYRRRFGVCPPSLLFFCADVEPKARRIEYRYRSNRFEISRIIGIVSNAKIGIVSKSMIGIASNSIIGIVSKSIISIVSKSIIGIVSNSIIVRSPSIPITNRLSYHISDIGIVWYHTDFWSMLQ